jgi:ABC-type lipoprotein export system ATPase subunit
VDLDVADGEFVSIVGRSGSGKTTLLNVISGLDTGGTGEIRVAGMDIPGLPDRSLSAFRSDVVGFVFQAYHILDHLTVAENVSLPSLFSRLPDALRGEALTKRVAEVLDSVGLVGRGEDRPADLSGGERQRVAIARSLLLRPRLLLCDEPTGNLDETTGAAVVDLLRTIHGSNVTILVVTHDRGISHAAERVLELSEGVLAPLTTPGAAS